MLAIPVFRSRVAPVLNWCSKVFIIPENTTECESGRELRLPDINAFDRLRLLRDEGVATLICGALSPDLLSFGENIGLHIIHGVAGEIGEVLEAYHERQLGHPRFWLPGCQGRRQYRAKRSCEEGCIGESRDKGGSMTQGRQGGSAKGVDHKKQQALSRGSTNSGRTGGMRGGPGGFCICTRCGTKVRHERGIPCTEARCPECEQPMVRD